MLSVMATPQEILDVEMPSSNAGPLQGTVNVITIISNNNNNHSSNNNNNNNNSSDNSNNNNNNGNIIPVESSVGVAGASSGSGTVEHSFVAIPLLERRRRSRSQSHCRITPLAPILCLSSQSGTHPEDLTQLSRSVSCFVRIRRSFAKFLGKIMGSNNPSEADRYDYYDYVENLKLRLQRLSTARRKS
ncbi:PREDICTED: GATA zinc finger domain-containing protein 15-like [Drosophila arizonae]|uniref:GATA zinc finger domain-containing protein 15-like n=1 Tax=Drosophila arizonae TaxID=7263 RepID=A0ABM1PZ04_DROAR|nr:PREDICTED: GATA zinc finger domain-containing protein 15-like [Drosophila arizonae]